MINIEVDWYFVNCDLNPLLSMVTILTYVVHEYIFFMICSNYFQMLPVIISMATNTVFMVMATQMDFHKFKCNSHNKSNHFCLQ